MTEALAEFFDDEDRLTARIRRYSERAPEPVPAAAVRPRPEYAGIVTFNFKRWWER